MRPTLAADSARRIASLIVTHFFVTVAPLALAAGTGPNVNTGSQGLNSFNVIPAQLAMGGRSGPLPPPIRKQTTMPARPHGAMATEESKRLAYALSHLTTADRKRIAKALKKLSPEGRQQVVDMIRNRVAGDGAAPGPIRRTIH
jgi:hypothetical protein